MPSFLARIAPGLEDLLLTELAALGAPKPHIMHGGVAWRGSLESGYRACLWSRLASRVVLLLGHFPAPTAEALYEGTAALPWAEHLRRGHSFAVRCRGRGAALQHSAFAALKVKDAVVDVLRDRLGTRPDVDREAPDHTVQVLLAGGNAWIGLDLSGRAMHARGLRDGRQVAAPLKETLAAAVLVRAGWDPATPLINPMCGSATLLLEGALMALDWAPGLLQDRPGLVAWAGHAPTLWAELVAEAKGRQAAAKDRPLPLAGWDRDPAAIAHARGAFRKLGLADRVRLTCADMVRAAPQNGEVCGHVVVNPPYGVRLGEAAALTPLYARLGQHLRQTFPGWQAHILIQNEALGHALGLRAHRRHSLRNGPLRCHLLHFHVHGPGPRGPSTPPDLTRRLHKVWAKVQPWAARQGLDCFRLYDADLPDYAAAVDIYGGWAHVQEYQAPDHFDPRRTERRLRALLAALGDALPLDPDRIVLKRRQRQRGAAQYGRQSLCAGQRFVVREGEARFWVNLTDHLDTGLFSSHREVRAWLSRHAAGRRFLNLFGYTGAATVQAALHGAQSSLTVDMSATYTAWARANFALNALGHQHTVERAECRQWLAADAGRYDLILIDPPTFSNSRGMAQPWVLHEDAVDLIELAGRRLTDEGVLIFSCNAHGFALDVAALAGWRVEDISRATLPRDYARRPRAHRAYVLRPPRRRSARRSRREDNPWCLAPVASRCAPISTPVE